MTKKVLVPQIDTLDMLDISSVNYLMEAKATKEFIDHANWGNYPYKPATAVNIARSSTRLYLSFSIKGLFLSCSTLNDNTPVTQDSSVGFFMQKENDPYYYNFDFNCVGTCNAAKRATRDAKEPLSRNEYKSIHRHSTIQRSVFEEISGLIAWDLHVSIPFETMGLNPNSLPEKIHVNFYKTAENSTMPHFLSWNPIFTPEPDFHRPEFFGELFL